MNNEKEFKPLSESTALDPYQDIKLKVISKLSVPSQAMLDFFTYMAEKGWNLYIKEDFLRNCISEFSQKMIKDLYQEDVNETFMGKRNYLILPRLCDSDRNRIMWKWQGNLMEIIAGNMFKQKVHPFTNKYELDCWVGNSKDDMGVDGWAQHVANPKFKIGIQVKYRQEKDIKWNDQISKCIAITHRYADQLARDGIFTDKECIEWMREIPAKSIIVTTTKIGDTVDRAVGKESYDYIDSDCMLKSIGKKNKNNGNKLFWERTLDSIK